MTMAAADFAVAARERVACAHCSLPVPAGLVEEGAAEQFCCQGCRTVFTLIHSCKLDRYYAYRAMDEAASAPAATTGKGYREFDDATFLGMHAPVNAEGVRMTDFYLEGVHCAACVWLVEKLPQIVAGVREARLDMGKSLVRIVWSDGGAKLSQIARTLDSLGYPPHPARAASARQVRTIDARRQLVRIGVAGACAGNAMLVGVALYAGAFGSMAPGYMLAFRFLSMAIGLVAVLWPGLVFFRGAVAAVRTRTPHLDLPIALGLAAGAAAGTFNTLMNRGEIYFDSLSVLVFLLLVGRFLQYRQQASSDDAVELLFSLTPMAARRVRADGAVEEVAISALIAEDVVEVLPGECVPADGVIERGASSLDESLLTGEALPRGLGVGERVFAGTTNLASPLRVKVAAVGEATRVGKLMRLVTQCAREKAPIVLLADRIAGYFLVAVLVVATVTLGLWLALGSATAAVDHAVAILIVACPCALGLATPLAVSVAIGRAARRGILIKGGATLERLARPGTLLLDKTGTLTQGRVSVVRFVGEEWARPLVAAVEGQATHPIARALVRELGASDLEVTELVQSMHGGIGAKVAGRRVVIGSAGFVEGCGVRMGAEMMRALEGVLAEGHTPVVVGVDGEAVGVFGLGDRLREDAAEALGELRARGWRLGILSGDHPAVVRRIAGELGIAAEEAFGGLLPEDKLRMVQEHLAREAGSGRPVVMVGDGVNDAAALAAASVGIAVQGGAEASLAAANVYLRTPGLGAIVELTLGAQGTLRTIRWAMRASLGYNILAVGLAVAGLINPLIAAVLMPVSSLTVLTVALATGTFGERRKMKDKRQKRSLVGGG